MGSKRILNVATPTASTDAATKAYVNNLVSTIASLTSIVNKPSTAPASGNINFWSSLRRENSGCGTTLAFFITFQPRIQDREGQAVCVTTKGKFKFCLPRAPFKRKANHPVQVKGCR